MSSMGYGFSALQVAGGVALCGSGVMTPVGAGLISSGVAGGFYLRNTDPSATSGREYVKKTFFGLVEGLVTGAAGHAFRAASLTTRIFGQAIAGGVNGALTAWRKKQEEENDENSGYSQEILGGVVAASLSSGVGSALNNIVGNASGAAQGVASHLLKGAVKGGASSAASQALSNVAQGHSITSGLKESLAVGAVIGGAVNGIASGPLAQAQTTEMDNFAKLEEIMKTPGVSDYSLAHKQYLTATGPRVQIQNDFVRYQTEIDASARPNLPVVLWDEIVKHVCLVHAINQDGFISRLLDWGLEDKIDHTKIADIQYRTSLALEYGLTPNGTVGHSLDLQQKQFVKGGFIDRPTMHWSWNQLVQPHSINSWENSQIALLEPLSTFENSVNQKVFCPAPYDTQTLGSHCLSENSIILVPEFLADQARVRLTQYRGTIITYNSETTNLRQAIARNLPRWVWSICDSEGRSLAENVHRTPSGYPEVTYLKKTNEKLLAIIKGSNEVNRHLDSLEASRYIGLHVGSPLFPLEDRNLYFPQIREFSKNRKITKNNPLFAGYVDPSKASKELGALCALKVYSELLSYDGATGAHTTANYVIAEAILADLVSVFFKMELDEEFALTADQVKTVLGPDQIDLFIQSLQDLSLSKTEAQSTQAFNVYKERLMKCAEDC